MRPIKPDKKKEARADIHTGRVWTEVDIGVGLCHLYNQAMELAHEKDYQHGSVAADAVSSRLSELRRRTITKRPFGLLHRLVGVLLCDILT